MPSMKPLVLVALLSSFVAVIPAARADDTSEAREHYRRGTKAYDLGHYEEAVKEYEAAYGLRDDPALLFNIAQAYRLAGDNQNAVRVYRSFLRKRPDTPLRAEVERRISELQKLLEQQGRAKEGQPEGTLPPSPVPAPTAPVEQPAVTPPPATAAAPEAAPVAEGSPRRARLMKIVGLAAAGVGIAAVATGIGLSVVARNDANDLTARNLDHQPFLPNEQSQGQTFDIAGPVLIGVGAALAVAGGAVALLGFREAKRIRNLSFAPSLSPQAVGARAAIEF